MSISNVNRQWILCADKKYCEDCGYKMDGGEDL